MQRQQRQQKWTYGAAAGLIAFAAMMPTKLLSEGRGGGKDSVWAVMRAERERFAPPENGYAPQFRTMGYAPQFRLTIPLFDDRRSLRPVPSQSAARKPAGNAQQRFACVRLCDGKQLVLGFDGSGVSGDEYAAMCEAAGGSADAMLVSSRIGGAEVQVETGAAAGRLYPSVTALLDELRGEKKIEACAPAIADRPLAVPIEADATLEAGDVVATAHGFKVFVGNGAAPHKEASFVDIGDAKRLSKQHRALVQRLATRD